jgi:hypothetical protein
MKYYLVMKMNGVLMRDIAWINLEITLSKSSQTPKVTVELLIFVST